MFFSETVRISENEDAGHDFKSSVLKLESLALIGQDSGLSRDMDDDWSETHQSESVEESLQSDWPEAPVIQVKPDENVGDWSDFASDTNISDEIEKELETMDREESVIENYDSDVKESPRKPPPLTKNAMKLKTKKAKPDQHSISFTDSSPNRSSSISKTNSHINSTTTRDLGSEFDIKSIDIKVLNRPEEDPMDFFADMAPKIEPSVNKGGLAAESETMKETSTGASKPSESHLSFNVLDTSPAVSITCSHLILLKHYLT